MHAYITNYIVFGEQALCSTSIFQKKNSTPRLAKGPVTHLLVEQRLVHLDTKFNNPVNIMKSNDQHQTREERKKKRQCLYCNSRNTQSRNLLYVLQVSSRLIVRCCCWELLRGSVQ